MSELLPCPFCGGTFALRYQGNDRTKSRKITAKCSGCRVQITHAAILHDFAWLEERIALTLNARAELAGYRAREAEVERLRKALEPFAKWADLVEESGAVRADEKYGDLIYLGDPDNGAIRLRDFRNARAALRGDAEGG